MKLLVSLVAVAVAVATPSLAASKKKKSPRAAQAYNQMYAHDGYGPQSRHAFRADPYDVYSYDGRLIGRDPDPNIRMRLRDEDAWLRHSP